MAGLHHPLHALPPADLGVAHELMHLRVVGGVALEGAARARPQALLSGPPSLGCYVLIGMPADPLLLSALVEALRKDPQSTPLRLHVANLLLESGAEVAALEHLTGASDAQPRPARTGRAQSPRSTRPVTLSGSVRATPTR